MQSEEQGRVKSAVTFLPHFTVFLRLDRPIPVRNHRFWLLVRAYVLQLKSSMSNPERWPPSTSQERERKFNSLLCFCSLQLTTALSQDHLLDSHLATFRVVLECWETAVFNHADAMPIQFCDN